MLIFKSFGIHDLLNFDFMDLSLSEVLLKVFELFYVFGVFNKLGELIKVGRRMVEFFFDFMFFKMIVVVDKYKCFEEIIIIVVMFSIGNLIFYRFKDK